jgi:hypothetical protein
LWVIAGQRLDELYGAPGADEIGQGLRVLQDGWALNDLLAYQLQVKASVSVSGGMFAPGRFVSSRRH